jgi:hypothetical protein
MSDLTRLSKTRVGRALRVRLMEEFEHEPQLDWRAIIDALLGAGLSMQTMAELGDVNESTVRCLRSRSIRLGDNNPRWRLGRTLVRLFSRLCVGPLPIITLQSSRVPRGTALRSTAQTVSSD